MVCVYFLCKWFIKKIVPIEGLCIKIYVTKVSKGKGYICATKGLAKVL